MALANFHKEPPAQKYCPLCNSHFEAFRPFASRRRMVQCPVCKSIDRNRLLYLYLLRETDLLNNSARLLHIAPERVLAQLFSGIGTIKYHAVDIDPTRPFVSEKMDIQDIHYAANTFDYIICSHVLEHIPDDVSAMEQMARVLKPGGKALILVPLRGAKTVEDAAFDTPELRRQHYGGIEHVRYYGLDIIDKLERAGHRATPVRYVDSLAPGEAERMALGRDVIIVCSKGL